MKIDSHHHLWKYDADQYDWISDEMALLQHDFLGDQLRDLAAKNSIDGFVSVQARQSIEETEMLLSIGDSEPLVRGVVGWLPLASNDLDESLDRFAGHPKLKGVRHVVQDEPDDQFLLRPEFNRGVAKLGGRGLVYDVLIFAKQLSATISFVQSHGNIPMVLDHIAKPTIRNESGVDKNWERGFRELAKADHLSCKFSGVATEVKDETWSIDTVRPYFDIALEAFGPDRLMFGSDWPVCLLKTTYSRWLETVTKLASELSDDEQAKFFSGNATRLYQL